MRDINRIDVLLNLLREYWKQDNNIDLRLGQLLYSIASELGKDLFCMEDDTVIEWLENKLGKDTHYKSNGEGFRMYCMSDIRKVAREAIKKKGLTDEEVLESLYVDDCENDEK